MPNLRPIGNKVVVKLAPLIKDVEGIEIPEAFRVHGWRGMVRRMAKGHKVLKKGDEVLVMKNYTTVFDRPEDLAMIDASLIMARIMPCDQRFMLWPVNRFVLIKPDEAVRDVGGIVLPEHKAVRANCGTVLRVGESVETEMRCSDKVYYKELAAVVVRENEAILHIAHELDIEMVVSNG
jgi:co-chaperonin GroES (HSP10)